MDVSRTPPHFRYERLLKLYYAVTMPEAPTLTPLCRDYAEEVVCSPPLVD